jgi:excisionase family DNA binding protein
MDRTTKILREIRNLKREVKKYNLFRKRFYTMNEASIVAGVSLSFIQKSIASNLIAHSRPSGKLIFIRRRDLETFLMKNYVHSSDDIDTIVANNLLNLKNKTL